MGQQLSRLGYRIEVRHATERRLTVQLRGMSHPVGHYEELANVYSVLTMTMSNVEIAGGSDLGFSWQLVNLVKRPFTERLLDLGVQIVGH